MSEGAAMKVLLLAGEESGMIYRERIAAELRARVPGVEIRGYGDYGFKTGDLAVMGIVQVLKKIRYFLRVKRTMKRAIDEWRPDVVCTVDYPGLNLRLAAYAKAKGIRTVHVVCPQVWAWHQGRIPKIERSLDRICCFFPFEPSLFRPGLGIFVGHPLVEEMGEGEGRRKKEEGRSKEGRSKEGRSSEPLPSSFFPLPSPLLAVLPGSRIGEIRHHLPKLVETTRILKREIPGLRVVVPAANEKARRAIAALGGANPPFEIRLGGARDLLRQADAAVVASGTATLEAALARCPTVLVYHVDLLFEVICRFVLKGVKHIGLINIVCEKTGHDCPMPELIQQDFTVPKMLERLRPWLTDAKANAAARKALDESVALLRTNGDAVARIVDALEARPRLANGL